MTRELLTVLVVDDELPLRQELRLFPWEAHGCELVGEAENGEEALQFCRSFSPDIVVTDITMPVMDGLMLFRTLREEQPHTQVILLTCHSEFAYAKEALKLGAVEYLVKVEMEERDLEQALGKAREAWSREASLRRNAAEELRWGLSKEFARLASASASASQGASSGGKPDIAAYLKQSFGLTLPLGVTALHVEAKKENRLLVKRAVETTLSLQERQQRYAWVPAEDGVYLLLFEHDALQANLLRSRLEALTGRLYEAVDEQLPFLSDAVRLYTVIGEPLRAPEEFGDAYRSVTNGHPQAFYDAAGRVFFAGVGRASLQLGDASVLDMREKLNRAKGNRSRLTACLSEELPRWGVKHRVHPDTLKGLVLEWRRIWLPDDAGLPEQRETAKAAQQAGTISELLAALLHEVETSEGRKPRIRKEIADAKAFIEQNLERPITLAIVSEHVGLSPHYLSRLFREETGFSFNDYVTRQRMERAVHLLQTTSMRVYEVAGAVGIPSYRYFTSMFREYTGASPTDYKKG